MLNVQTAGKPPDASMEISDRLDLLSLVAVMWGVLAIITASLFGLALAAAQRETGCDYRYVNFDECYTGADIVFFLGILLLFVFGAVPTWFLSIGKASEFVGYQRLRIGIPHSYGIHTAGAPTPSSSINRDPSAAAM